MQNPIERWEIIKSEIINYCKQASTERAQYKRDEMDRLETTCETLTRYIATTPEECYIKEIEAVKNRIKVIEEERSQAAAFRARAKWTREGEKTTKYFFSLEKRNFSQKTMHRLNVNGDIITEQKNIMAEQIKFYEDLYRSNKEICFNLTNTTDVKLSDNQVQAMDKDISLQEATTALNEMKNDRAPGCDGLTTNLFKVIWSKIGPQMIKLFNFCYTTGRLNPSARRGIITLIPKKKDPSYLRNWRPLTLLNIDYKILAKLLANRMKKVLPDIIGDQQTGFMENRCITENIRLTMDIIANVYQQGKRALIISIDYEKCFDKIEHSAVEGSLKYFGFSPKFVRWIRLFFTDFIVCTNNAGYNSDFFSKSRGVNQGCPISPYLFLVCGETMAHLIKNNPKIHGIKLGNTKHVSHAG